MTNTQSAHALEALNEMAASLTPTLVRYLDHAYYAAGYSAEIGVSVDRAWHAARRCGLHAEASAAYAAAVRSVESIPDEETERLRHGPMYWAPMAPMAAGAAALALVLRGVDEGGFGFGPQDCKVLLGPWAKVAGLEWLA